MVSGPRAQNSGGDCRAKIPALGQLPYALKGSVCSCVKWVQTAPTCRADDRIRTTDWHIVRTISVSAVFIREVIVFTITLMIINKRHNSWGFFCSLKMLSPRPPSAALHTTTSIAPLEYRYPSLSLHVPSSLPNPLTREIRKPEVLAASRPHFQAFQEPPLPVGKRPPNYCLADSCTWAIVFQTQFPWEQAFATFCLWAFVYIVLSA